MNDEMSCEDDLDVMSEEVINHGEDQEGEITSPDKSGDEIDEEYKRALAENDQEYEFEYEDDMIGQEDVSHDIENLYYDAKYAMDSDLQRALDLFTQLIQKQSSKDRWSFKASKNIVKILFKMGRFEEMVKKYQHFLTYTTTIASKNQSEKAITSILNLISTGKFEMLEKVYELTLDTLKNNKIDRLWFNTMMKLARYYFEIKGNYGQFQKAMRQLQAYVKLPDGVTDDKSKASQIVEMLALQVQFYAAQKNYKKLKTLYQKAQSINQAIVHPLNKAIIHEYGGKVMLQEKEYKIARDSFYQAFQLFSDAGSSRRIPCLQYYVLTTMLDPNDQEENIDILSINEIRATQVASIKHLFRAYKNNDVPKFDSILEEHQNDLMQDEFIRSHINELRRNLRSNSISQLVKPYRRIRIGFISKELNIPQDEVEELLVSLILDRVIEGRIDQLEQILVRFIDPNHGLMPAAAAASSSTTSSSLLLFSPNSSFSTSLTPQSSSTFSSSSSSSSTSSVSILRRQEQKQDDQIDENDDVKMGSYTGISSRSLGLLQWSSSLEQLMRTFPTKMNPKM